MSGKDQHLTAQIEKLIQIINKNPAINRILDQMQDTNLSEYYIGAGCIAQTVWNDLSSFPIDRGINDIDIAYYDCDHITYEAEDEIVKKLNHVFGDINIELDIKNQARVHYWYEDHFGYQINPITSLEDAVNRWPTTSTAIGIRKKGHQYLIYAPYGLNDLFSMVVRPNKLQITRQIYEAKIKRWITIWPGLKIVDW